MNKAHALVVDDEADILDLLKITLARMDVQATTAMIVAEAKTALQARRFDLCLTDMNLPDGSGIDLVPFIAKHHPNLPVAMVTAHDSIESAVAAMKAGAFDFFSKPVDLQLLRRLVGSALKLRTQVRTQGTAAEARTESGTRLLDDSSKVEEIRRLIVKLTRNQAPVFITGESGTGKELEARLIHAQGPRAEGNFVAVNCGAIPQKLVESELFGHKKGSFTGAVADKEGLFQAAESGTLFLNEVADLLLPAQVKLLRAIQEKSVRPVGAQQELAVDVRIISASHRDLNEEAFPSNVRKLENVLERAAPRSATASSPTPMTSICRRPRPRSRLGHARSPRSPWRTTWRKIERHAILKALDDTRWNRTAAAKKLGMTLRALHYTSLM